MVALAATRVALFTHHFGRTPLSVLVEYLPLRAAALLGLLFGSASNRDMMKNKKKRAVRKKQKNKAPPSLLERLGPGLITGASDDDPSGKIPFAPCSSCHIGRLQLPVPLQSTKGQPRGDLQNLNLFPAKRLFPFSGMTSPVQESLTNPCVGVCHRRSGHVVRAVPNAPLALASNVIRPARFLNNECLQTFPPRSIGN